MVIILDTENKNWGFWGTAKGYLKNKIDMQEVWNGISKLLQKETLLTPEQTRKFLDSRWGRHFADRYCEELRTNAETFIKTVERVLTKSMIIENYRHYVDDKAFWEEKTTTYDNFSKELTDLCKKYGICLQSIGGVRVCPKEIKSLAGYTSDLDSGDLIPIWHY